MAGGKYVERRADVDACRATLDRLGALSPTPAGSRAITAEALADYR